jgi:four helix bundle protein
VEKIDAVSKRSLFNSISRGSLYELDTLFNIAEMIGFLQINRFNNINENINECGKIINGSISYYEKSDLK